MADEVERAPANRPRPLKTIPAERDRLQSRILTWILVPLTCACIILGVLATGEQGGLYQIAGISLAFAVIVRGMGSATTGGALCGALLCFCITWWTRDLTSPLMHSDLPALFALFLLTFAATRAGKKQKLARGLAERIGGRTSAQVLANLATAALVVTPIGAWIAAALARLPLPVAAPVLASASLAALAEATADTVSSEIGQAFGKRTYMLTNLRRVHRGTDGGISLEGTLAGLVASLLVILIGGWALRMSPEAQLLAFFSGVIGLFADSLLGATLERRNWIGNDVVNLTSTAISAFCLLLLARFTSAFVS